MFISVAGRLVDFSKVNNSKRPDHGGDVKAILGQKQVCKAFKKASLDSTRCLSQCVLGHIIHRKEIELFYFSHCVANQEPLTSSTF